MSFARTRSAGRSALLLLAVLGCKAEAFGADDDLDLATDPVTLVPSRQWSGGEVRLVSSGLTGLREEEVEVRVAGRQLAVTRIAPETLAVRLPDDLPSGAYPVTLSVNRSDWEIAPVVAVGWTASRSIGTGYCSDPTPWPLGRPTGILVTSCVRDQPPMFISTEGLVTTFAGLTGTLYSPSVSYRPEAVNDRSGVVARLDRFGRMWDSLASGRTFSRHGYELGPGIWLTTSNHDGVLSNAGTGTSTPIQLESEWLLVRSPASPRATFVVSVANPGIPILDTENGTILARVDGLAHSDAAVFSPDGVTLYAIAGPDWCCTTSLAKIATGTGEVLQTVPAIDSTVSSGAALAVDPGTPDWLYEFGTTATGYTLRIRNSADLSVVAEFTTAVPVIPFTSIFPGLVIDAAHRRGYVFLDDYPAGHLLQFDLLLPGE